MATLIRLFPYLLAVLFAAVVLHHFLGVHHRGKGAHRKMPRQYYRWDERSLHR
jgi:hypothetical protein